jgi:hypothetical protein
MVVGTGWTFSLLFPYLPGPNSKRWLFYLVGRNSEMRPIAGGIYRKHVVLTKIYHIYPFIYQNIQYIGVFTNIFTVNGDPVAGYMSPATGTPATP